MSFLKQSWLHKIKPTYFTVLAQHGVVTKSLLVEFNLQEMEMAKRARLEVTSSDYTIATRWNPGSCCEVALPAFAPVGLRAASARLMCGLHSAAAILPREIFPRPNSASLQRTPVLRQTVPSTGDFKTLACCTLCACFSHTSSLESGSSVVDVQCTLYVLDDEYTVALPNIKVREGC